MADPTRKRSKARSFTNSTKGFLRRRSPGRRREKFGSFRQQLGGHGRDLIGPSLPHQKGKSFLLSNCLQRRWLSYKCGCFVRCWLVVERRLWRGTQVETSFCLEKESIASLTLPLPSWSSLRFDSLFFAISSENSTRLWSYAWSLQDMSCTRSLYHQAA